MTTEIKEYKECCLIIKKDWSTIQTTTKLENLEKRLNSWIQFIRFGDELVNKFDIMDVKIQKMSDIDQFIASITDTEKKKRLKDIKAERENKNLSIMVLNI